MLRSRGEWGVAPLPAGWASLQQSVEACAGLSFRGVSAHWRHAFSSLACRLLWLLAVGRERRGTHHARPYVAVGTVRDPPYPSSLLQVCYVLGPFRDSKMNESIFLCPACDKRADYPEFEREFDEQMPAAATVTCCVDWLDGRELVADKVKGIPPRTVATAWDDPYPGDMSKAPKHRRFFYYKMTALELGIREERRVRHAACLQDHIAHLFPDEAGSPTKVGYEQRD